MRSNRLKHKVSAPGQGELFAVEQIANIYKANPDQPLTNQALYEIISNQLGVSKEAMIERVPVGASGAKHSLVQRAVRFCQQSLKALGVIERVHGEGDLVIDPWAGRNMTSLAAELLGRTWMSGELMLQHIRTGAELFRGRPGFWLNPQIAAAFSG